MTFTPDGKYIFVQNYSESDLLVFRMTKTGMEKTTTTVKLSGYPASIRIAP